MRKCLFMMFTIAAVFASTGVMQASFKTKITKTYNVIDEFGKEMHPQFGEPEGNFTLKNAIPSPKTILTSTVFVCTWFGTLSGKLDSSSLLGAFASMIEEEETIHFLESLMKKCWPCLFNSANQQN